MTSEEGLILYSREVISFMESKGFDFIDKDANDNGKMFFDFILGSWIVPITVLIEYYEEVSFDGKHLTAMSILFNCYGHDYVDYFHGHGNSYGSNNIVVVDNSEILIHPEELDLQPNFMVTFNAIIKRNKEIATQIVNELPSQEYFVEYYNNFENDYDSLERFLKASGIREEQLIDMYARIDKVDRLPESVKDVFLF